VEGSLHAAKEFNQFIETGIAAGIPTTADSDTFKVTAFSLQVGKRFIRDCLEILKPAVLFLHTTGTVITPFFKWQTVSAPKWLNTANFLKITILAESAAVDPGAPSNIHGQLCHLYY
jgi:hypothetical protein